MRSRGRQRGTTLVELALTGAIAFVILAGVADAVTDALQIRTQALTQNDVAQQAAFAMGRMVAGVRAATPPAAGTALAAATVNSTGTWLPQVTYTYDPATGKLSETAGAATSVLADHVTAFAATLHTTAPASGVVYIHPVIDLALTLTNDSGGTVSVVSTTRMGGGTQ